MTRFARAKGSKSSNERIPEEATAWSVLKKQLEEKRADATNAQEVQAMRASIRHESQQLLKKKEHQNKVQWAEFEATKITAKQQEQNNSGKKKKKLKGEISHSHESSIDSTHKKKKKSKDLSIVECNAKESVAEKKGKVRDLNSSEDFTKECVSGKKKKNIKDFSNSESANTEEGVSEKKKKKKKRVSNGEENPTESVSGMKMNRKDSRSTEGEFKERIVESNQTTTTDTKDSSFSMNVQQGSNRMPEKDEMSKKRKLMETGGQGFPRKMENNATEESEQKQWKRRKPYVETSTISVNGITISVAKYDGFDVKAEDAERLKDLRKRMLNEGVPRAQVDQVMKLERRKAEKALAREKKKVCFNCRKAGHLLSECPEVGSNEGKRWDSGSTGICYKCGSTEHTHFQCRVQKKQEYRFAKCFICHEQGHISSQCPDNPKGLYPQGGCCKICGEVTHLKKDCPQLAKERTENTVTIDSLNSDRALEGLEEDHAVKPQISAPLAKKNKVIKF